MFTLAEYETLSSATEDLCRLWEALWRINTVFPEKTPEERVAMADAAIRRLVDEGLIEIYRVDQRRQPTITMGESRAMSAEEEQEVLPAVDERYPADVLLSSAEVHDLLDKPGIWEPTSPVYIGFMASKAGFDVYYKTPPPDRNPGSA